MVKRTLAQVYSEFVQLKSRREIVGQLATKASIDGRQDSFKTLCEEYKAISERLEYLSDIEVEYNDVYNKPFKLDVNNCIK